MTSAPFLLQAIASSARAVQRLIDDAGFGPDDGNSPNSDGDLGSLFDRLVTNKDIRIVSRMLFADRHYARATEEALKCLNNEVKALSGLQDLDGAPLMQKAFGGKFPILRFNGLRTRSEKDEQQGYAQLYAGAMMGIRNPRAHEHYLNHTPEVALEILVLANHLLCKLADAMNCDSSQENAATS